MKPLVCPIEKTSKVTQVVVTVVMMPREMETQLVTKTKAMLTVLMVSLVELVMVE